MAARNTHRLMLPILVILIQQQIKAGSEQPSAVTLLSTLRQGSLCPGDGSATFTCTCRGTDLTWIVGGRMMSYNRNALVGAVRSNADSDETAILLRVDRLGGEGLASRVSVLTIKEKQHVTQPVTVQCHNGSVSQVQAKTFWQKVAAIPEMPRFKSAHYLPDGINISWSLPDQNTEMQTIDHYEVQVESAAPMLLKNESVVVFHTQKDKRTYSVYIRAVDECGQRGEVLRKDFVSQEQSDPAVSHAAEEVLVTRGGNTGIAEMQSGEKKLLNNILVIIHSLGLTIHFIIFLY